MSRLDEAIEILHAVLREDFITDRLKDRVLRFLSEVPNHE